MQKTPILTAELMRRCDTYTIETLGVPSQVLMERAARGVIDYLYARPELFPFKDGGIVVLCGGGNNGGDGFAAARFLHERSVRVTVIYGGRLTAEGAPDQSAMSPECARQYALATAASIPVCGPAQIGEYLSQADAVIDALFGIGLDRPVGGALAALIEAVNENGLPVLAVDIPSGIHSDTGAIMGVAVKATATVTMQALKAGLLLYPGAELCGEIKVCDIGVDLTLGADTRGFLADKRFLSSLLPPRERRSHKGTYGRLGLVCGTRGMSGAAILAAKGALRTGAGLIQAITSEDNRAILQVAVPEAILTCYDPSQPVSASLVAAVSACDGVVIGCGLGVSPASEALLGALLEALPLRPDFPVVLDADALNLLSRRPHLWNTRLLTEGRGQVILTPHPTEMSRLTERPVGEILSSPVSAALALAARRGVTVVLKDAHTVIASPDGRWYLSPHGNAGMAKGGSGDVLAGVIGSLAVQRRHDLSDTLTPTKIAAAGVALHGIAGDLAAEAHGEYAMTPSDMIDAISAVTRGLSRTRTVIF